MIWTVRDRHAFARLAVTRTRRRGETLWCNYVSDPTAMPPRVAFAIGRAVGPAVARNRLRRRLRAILRAAPVPPGWLLIGAQPSAVTRTFAELDVELRNLLSTLPVAAAQGPVE